MERNPWVSALILFLNLQIYLSGMETFKYFFVLEKKTYLYSLLNIMFNKMSIYGSIMENRDYWRDINQYAVATNMTFLSVFYKN